MEWLIFFSSFSSSLFFDASTSFKCTLELLISQMTDFQSFQYNFVLFFILPQNIFDLWFSMKEWNFILNSFHWNSEIEITFFCEVQRWNGELLHLIKIIIEGNKEYSTNTITHWRRDTWQFLCWSQIMNYK